ncbi:MAG: hypothetical protein KJO12_08650 [Ignavibacteria bacterium]|nr:hypothetical protein [Ignavibacteria bacterium]
MATSDFILQLKSLGYEPQEPALNKVCFIYIVDGGKNHGKKVWLGFENIHDFPLNCPHGPHFKTIDKGWINPAQGIHTSNFGAGWIHWSRPFNEWNRTKKSVKEYLAHIKNLLLRL